MLVLLPPSEGKTVPRRGRALDLGRLSFPALTPTREAVLRSLMSTSAGPDALTVLGVPPTLGDEVARNRALTTAPTAPAATPGSSTPPSAWARSTPRPVGAPTDGSW